MNDQIKPQRGLSIESIAADPVRMRVRCEALVVAMVAMLHGQKNSPNTVPQ